MSHSRAISFFFFFFADRWRWGANVPSRVRALRWMCRYPYVSHLVCNAGVAPFLNISWLLFAQQAWRNLLELSPFKVVTHPGFYSQHIGMMSDDGLGWVWQCNVFRHYILVRPIRVLFISALFVLTHTVNFFSSVGRWRQSLRRRRRSPVASCGCPHIRHTRMPLTQRIGKA
jgi:hypothetical protein